MSNETRPSGNLVKLTAGASDIATGVTRSLWVGTAGTATFIDAMGNTCTDFPLKEGSNPFQIKRLSSLGTAADVWAVY